MSSAGLALDHGSSCFVGLTGFAGGISSSSPCRRGMGFIDRVPRWPPHAPCRPDRRHGPGGVRPARGSGRIAPWSILAWVAAYGTVMSLTSTHDHRLHLVEQRHAAQSPPPSMPPRRRTPPASRGRPWLIAHRLHRHRWHLRRGRLVDPGAAGDASACPRARPQARRGGQWAGAHPRAAHRAGGRAPAAHRPAGAGDERPHHALTPPPRRSLPATCCRSASSGWPPLASTGLGTVAGALWVARLAAGRWWPAQTITAAIFAVLVLAFALTPFVPLCLYCSSRRAG